MYLKFTLLSSMFWAKDEKMNEVKRRIVVKVAFMVVYLICSPLANAIPKGNSLKIQCI